MKKKILYVIYYILMSLPVPISLMSWIGTLISVADIGMMSTEGIIGMIHGVIALLSMFFAGTYLITYIYSLYRTTKDKKINFITFLPVVHIVLIGTFIFLWSCFD